MGKAVKKFKLEILVYLFGLIKIIITFRLVCSFSLSFEIVCDCDSPRRPGSGRRCDNGLSCRRSAAPSCSPPWGWCGPWPGTRGSPPGPRTPPTLGTRCWPALKALAPEVGSNLCGWGFDPSTVKWKQGLGYAAWARPGSRCLHTCRSGLQSLQQSQTVEREGTEWENERVASCDYSGSGRCAKLRCHWPRLCGERREEAAVEAHWEAGQGHDGPQPHCLSSPRLRPQIEQADLGSRPLVKARARLRALSDARRGWRWGRAQGWGWGWRWGCLRPGWPPSLADSCSHLLQATAWHRHSTPCNQRSVRSGGDRRLVTWVEEGLCCGCETGERVIRGRGEVTEVGDRRGTVSSLVQGIAGNRESGTSLTNHLQRL